LTSSGGLMVLAGHSVAPKEVNCLNIPSNAFAYEDRVVILKERGIDFPTNFESVGYIEFDANSLEAQTMEILKELIGFGLVKVTPA
jgi:hypothetical protein